MMSARHTCDVIGGHKPCLDPAYQALNRIRDPRSARNEK